MISMNKDVITLLHGAGGSYMYSLIKEIFYQLNDGFGEISLGMLDDGSIVNNIAFTTDSFIVRPIFFKGGDIGRLSVTGTVNDIAMMGGDPAALSLGVIIEEGFKKEDLEKIVKSIKDTSIEAGVHIITGDTKVMERGSIDKIVINTSGIGFRSRQLDHNIETLKKTREPLRWLVPLNLRPGDKIIVTGSIGDHAIAILSSREGIGFQANIVSDAAPLNKLMNDIMEIGGIADAKDPTRGGLADLLNDWSEKSKLGIYLKEENIPVKDEVRSAVEFMGMDIMELGNEGKAVIAVSPEFEKDVLNELWSNPLGKDTAVIGEVTKDVDGVVMETVIGGKRYIGRPLGDPVPRIC